MLEHHFHKAFMSGFTLFCFCLIICLLLNDDVNAADIVSNTYTPFAIDKSFVNVLMFKKLTKESKLLQTKSLNDEINFISLNSNLLNNQDSSKNVWEDWGMPIIVTAGCGLTVYLLYSVRGR